MENNHLFKIDHDFWSKKILYFYWLLASVSIVGQLVGLAVTIYYYPDNVMEFFLTKVVVLIISYLFIMLLCEYIIRVRKIYHSGLLMVTGTFLALVIIVINPAVPGLQTTLLLPMAVALIYFEKSKLVFSFLINITGLASVHVLFPAIRMNTSEYEVFSYFFVLFCGLILYLAILERGNEVMAFLRQAAAKEKELLVRSTMMEKSSKVDGLTGLYNHKTFHEYLDLLVGQCETNQTSLQLAVIDIDNFKRINDTYGHSVGDVVLKQVASTIAENVTGDDIVARYGGEEFAILMTGKTFEESYKIIEGIRLKIADIHHRELEGQNVTVSIGLANYEYVTDKSDFFNQADTLLYEGKRTGKNKVVFKI